MLDHAEAVLRGDAESTVDVTLYDEVNRFYERRGFVLRRHFTTEGVHPYDELAWERREATG